MSADFGVCETNATTHMIYVLKDNGDSSSLSSVNGTCLSSVPG